MTVTSPSRHSEGDIFELEPVKLSPWGMCMDFAMRDPASEDPYRNLNRFHKWLCELELGPNEATLAKLGY